MYRPTKTNSIYFRHFKGQYSKLFSTTLCTILYGYGMELSWNTSSGPDTNSTIITEPIILSFVKSTDSHSSVQWTWDLEHSNRCYLWSWVKCKCRNGLGERKPAFIKRLRYLIGAIGVPESFFNWPTSCEEDATSTSSQSQIMVFIFISFPWSLIPWPFWRRAN